MAQLHAERNLQTRHGDGVRRLVSLFDRFRLDELDRIPIKNSIIERPDGALISYRYRRANETNGQRNIVIAFQGGWTMHPGSHLAQIEAFEGEYSVLTMENRGHWYSGLGGSTPETYIRDMAEDMKATMDREEIGKIVIVGHSMWGGTALMFHNLFPDRVAGLVLVCPGYTDPRNLGFLREYPQLHFFTELLARAAARASPIDYVKKVLSKSPLAWEAIRIGLLFTFMRDGYNPAHVEKMIKNVLRANTDAMAISMLALFRLDETLYERAADIKVPVWLIAGDDDPLISEESVRRLANRIPGSRLEVFHGVGHFPMLSDATKFNETIRCFMEEVSALQRV